jgi:hypothetical protein
MLSKELLERFKRGEVVFHTPTQEIFDRAVEAVQSIGLPTVPKWIYGRSGEQTGIDFTTGECIGYAFVDYYRDNFTELEIITLKLSDFNSETKEVTQVIPLDIQEKLMRITYSIAYCTKLERTYGIDLDFGGLYDKRNDILKELEDSLEIHI